MKFKKVTDKHYNFELDIARDKIECIRIRYPFSFPPLEIDFAGVKYHGIIGTTYKPSELVVIENKLMGPCWLEVEDARVNWGRHENSHCRLELSVDSVERIIGLKPGEEEVPKFSMMSVSLIKDKTGDNPIRIISALYTSNYDVEIVQPLVPTIPLVFVVVDDENKSKKQQFKQYFGEHISFYEREYALLSAFVQNIARLDPDLIVGHDVNNIFYEVIISRMQKLDIQLGSSLSRFKRDQKEMKHVFRQNGLKKIRSFTIGRMVCDTHQSSAEIIRETNYELDYLAEKYLNETNVCSYRTTSQDHFLRLCHTIDESILNAHLSLSLCQKLQLVQLSKQLTNVSGCFLYQSFQNARAERNEMLLMHTFYRSGFIFPDKFTKKWEDGQKAKKRDKPKYEGGLVLEPVAGLYKDYILLLDFNSLYPSIIREYKICFTTVRRDFVDITFYVPNEKEQRQNDQDDDDSQDGQGLVNLDRIPDHDPSGVKEQPHTQILPKIVQNLIKKRQEIKNEIKRTKDKTLLETLDIKQKAYKLIANSIYGCLGFKNSRFYARQLAALITSYGRNILQLSAKKVTELGHEVVYGDTDSLMINSRDKNLLEAIKKGNDIKKAINSQYKNKILEIEVDGIFRSLLLLKKKKYAADKLQNLDEVQKNLDDRVARFVIEKKGLDIVRRDWSGLTKRVGDHLVDVILDNTKETEDTLIEIYDYLTNVKAELLKSTQAHDPQFIIYKQLNKNPNQYTEKGQPHVVVAKKMLAGGHTVEQLINHFIPYVIVDEGDPSKSFSERAYHPEEAKKLKLKPDTHWYINNQLSNPIARLLEYLPGINLEKVAEILGIEVKKLSQELENKEAIQTTQTFEESDSILYSSMPIAGNVVTWTCSKCGHKNSIQAGSKMLSCSAKVGPSDFCRKVPNEHWLRNEATDAMRRYMNDYYSSLLVANRKGGDRDNPKGLPVIRATRAAEAEKEVNEAVMKVNSTLFKLEKIFDNKSVSEKSLKQIFSDCHAKINTFRRDSAYENIEFGELCARVTDGVHSSRHYKLLTKIRQH